MLITGNVPIKLPWKVLIPVAVLGLAWVASTVIRSHPPQPETRSQPDRLPVVDVARLTPVDFPVVIEARGVVEPTLATALVAEVSGTIVALSDSLSVGGSFAANEVLVQLDDEDYRIALTQARATVAQNRAQLLEQQALAEQAANEWRALGRSGEPSTLTLREPQVAAAQANLDAAEAQLDRARLDLERTRLRAPYDGRVLERRIELGEFVNRGVTIGRVRLADSLDVRLPLGGAQLGWLPSLDDGTPNDDLPRVQIRARLAQSESVWDGRLVRAEGLDPATQQVDVIARVGDRRTETGASLAALRPGQFVEASIEGTVLESVFVIPRSAVREQSFVLILDDDDRVYRRDVDVVWTDDDSVIVASGLETGERLVLTRLSVVADGTPVRPSSESDDEGDTTDRAPANSALPGREQSLPDGDRSLSPASNAAGTRDEG